MKVQYFLTCLMILFGGEAFAATNGIDMVNGGDTIFPAGGTATSTSATMNFSNTTTNGDSIVCIVTWDDNGSINVSSVTDNFGNTLIHAGSKNYSAAAGYSIDVWYKGNITGSTDSTVPTVTATYSASTPSTADNYIECAEYSGIITGVDQNANTNSTSTSLSIGPVTTTSANELAVATAHYDTGVPGTSGAPWSAQEQTQDINTVFYETGASGSVVSGTYTNAFSGNGQAIVTTFTVANGAWYYQGNSVSKNGSGTSVSTGNFSFATIAGDSILCWIEYTDGGSRTVTQVTDTQGNTFTGTGPKVYDSADGWSDDTWFVSNIRGGTENITVKSSAAGSIDITCLEFAGPNMVVDQVAAATVLGGATSISIGPVTTTGPADLIFVDGFTGAATTNVTQGWNEPVGTVDMDEFELAPAGSVTGSVTWDITNDGSFKMVAFKAQTSGCANPVGDVGAMQFLAGPGKVKFCNGTSWVDTTYSIGSACTAGGKGTIQYNAGVYQYCDGANWYGMKGPSLGSCSGTTAGTMQYVSGSGIYEFCDGSNWYVMAANTCTIALSSPAQTTWTVPSDFNSTFNSVFAIGAGGGGDNGAAANGQAGGGGGAFSGVTGVTLTPGATVGISVGLGGAAATAGGNSYLCNTTGATCAPSGAAVLVAAQGGSGASGTTAGGGGITTWTSAVGTIKNGGGSGHTNSTNSGGGGGGAGGPNGTGKTPGGTGGAAGDNGSGGAAVTINNPGNAGNEWGAGLGSGSGGGAGGNAKVGQPGGAAGGGGGGAGTGTAKTGGSGGNGILVIQYTGYTCS